MTDINDLGTPPDDDGEPTQASRVEKLADELAGIYDYRRLPELEKEDPGRAREHREAAQELVTWLNGCPRAERRGAFLRGWDKAKERRNERAEERIRELEDLLSTVRPANDQESSATAVSWRRARQDPRFDLIRREAANLDRYDGTSVIPRPLTELLAVRVMTALLDFEARHTGPHDE